jgi:hypothetical protein
MVGLHCIWSDASIDCCHPLGAPQVVVFFHIIQLCSIINCFLETFSAFHIVCPFFGELKRVMQLKSLLNMLYCFYALWLEPANVNKLQISLFSVNLSFHYSRNLPFVWWIRLVAWLWLALNSSLLFMSPITVTVNDAVIGITLSVLHTHIMLCGTEKCQCGILIWTLM